MQTHPATSLSPAFSAWVMRRARIAGPFALAMLVAGCMTDPAAPLIPTPERQATVLPTDVHALDADGYPNVLSDPSSVAGLPRTQRSVEASEAALDAERAASQAEVAGIPSNDFAADLARRGRNHAAAAQRAIEATGRPAVPGIQDAALNTAPPGISPAGAAASAVAAPPASTPGPATPVDPSAPLPRPVGVPPFRGTPNSD